MAVFDEEDIEGVREFMNAFFGNLAGPVSDLIRASTNATVDSLIDARERMLNADWPPDTVDAVLISIVNRNADVAKKIGEATVEAQKRQR